MYSTKTLTILAATTLFMAAPLAFAGEVNTADMNTYDKTAPQVVSAKYAETVLAAVERSDYIPVTDENGVTYLNKIVDIDELPNPQLELETVDTYTYEYEGRVYTNKVVVED